MKPICITDAKLYATWDEDQKPLTRAVQEWAEAQPDLGCEMHLLAGQSVPRIFPSDSPPPPSGQGVLVPLEPLEPPAAPAQVPQPRSRAREVAKLVAPPAAVIAYRRARAWRKKRAAS